MLFTKMHGLGNDFVLFDDTDGSYDDYGDIAKRICDRHFGVGADGILVVKNSDIADARMLIFNSDGSQAEMCGNGIRCFAKHIYERAGRRKDVLHIETLDGIKTVEVMKDGGDTFLAKVNMGRPDTAAGDVPVATERERVINERICVDGKVIAITSLLIGVPHTVIFVTDIDESIVESVGRSIEKSGYFPRGTNVDFVRVDGRGEFTIRTWERGAGATLACGTGVCASLVACVMNGKTENAAAAHLYGGDMMVEWASDGCVYMTGPAVTVYRGELTISKQQLG